MSTRPPETMLWEARVEGALSEWIQRYLQEHPPPGPTSIGGDLSKWAFNLGAHSRELLHQHLRAQDLHASQDERAPLQLVRNGPPSPPITGQQVLCQVADLIAEHLPGIPFDDPDRGVLATLMHAAPPDRSNRVQR